MTEPTDIWRNTYVVLFIRCMVVFTAIAFSGMLADAIGQGAGLWGGPPVVTRITEVCE